jgi:biopolymer transport protein ExbD
MKQHISNREAHRLIRRYRSTLEADEEHTGLNITAMMDMMTILLVFLLKSFAVSSGLIVPSENDLRLPKAAITGEPPTALVVAVTKKALLVEGQTIFALGEGRLYGERRSGQSLEIKELKQVLSMIGELNEEKAKAAGIEYKRRLLLVADKDTPYDLIVSIVYTGLLATFNEYQLVVISTKAG